MPTVSRFDSHGGTFIFEPPVEVGDHDVDSLEKLAAIAIMGPDVSSELLAMGQQQAETAISAYSGDKDMLGVLLNGMLATKHFVSVS